MDQPPTPNPLPSTPSPPKKDNSTGTTTTTTNGGAGRKQRPPTPEELVALYESQGLDPREAALKAIGDLQTVLYRTVVSSRGKKDRFITDTVRKLDNVNTRLAILDMKLDTKPGIPESVAIGVASGALLHGAAAAMPHVLEALGQAWDAVKTATRPPTS